MSNHDGMPDMPDMPPSGDLKNTTSMSTMSLTWSPDVVVLFAKWPGHNHGMYVLALFFIFLLAVAVEVLSVFPKHKPGTAPFISALSQTSVYTFRTTLAYLVMLSVMSFNIGILIAAVAGHALGFFIVKALAHQNQPKQSEPKV